MPLVVQAMPNVINPTTTSSSESSGSAAAGAAAIPASTAVKGVAGRINYAQWDKVASDLIQQTEEEEKLEKEEAATQLGLNGTYARSAAEAEERAKHAKVRQTKETLDAFAKRESAVMASLSKLFVTEKEDDQQQQQKPTVTKQIKRITRHDLEAGHRVVTVTDCHGTGVDTSTIVLTQDLSLLESAVPTNPRAKAFAGDAENAVAAPNSTTATRPVYGIIKLFLSHLSHCTVVIRCKIITGTVELHHCQNVKIVAESTGTVATVQADLSEDVTMEFRDAPSGKSVPGQHPPKYWGDDPDDRVFHAGLTNLTVVLVRDGMETSRIVSDYKSDGIAKAVGNATLEEFQCVTSCLDDSNGGTATLVTEAVVRAGNTTGANVRAMTQREMAAEQSKRERAAKMAVRMAEDMIQIKDKDGNVLVKKTDPQLQVETAKEDDDTAVEEVVSPDIQDVVKECETLKTRGNEAFGAGEYGQAILHYSLSIDKAAELGSPADDDSSTPRLFTTDIVYSNRAAAFLKLGQHDKAAADASAALTLNPDNTKANFRLGLALHASKRYVEAMPVLAKAHTLEPKNAQIKQALQFCEVRLQQEHRQRMMQN